MSEILPRFFSRRAPRLAPGISFADYQSIPAVNASVLKCPTRLEMHHYITGMDVLPPAERALLEMTGANVSTVLERVSERQHHTVPRGFASLVAPVDPGMKMTKAQRALLEACAGDPVDTRLLNARTLGVCIDNGWITTEIRELPEVSISPQVKESRAIALAIGKATHTAILEPHLFDKDTWQQHYQLCSTKSLTSERALAALADDPSRELLTAEMIDTARRCRDAVYQHKHAAHLLSHPGHSEITGEVWDDEMGVMRKIRIDRLPSDPSRGFIDVKTIHSSLLLEPVRSSVYKFGYGQQSAFYLDTLAMIEGRPRDAAYLIGVTKEAPFMARVFELAQVLPEESFIQRGRDIYGERIAEFCLGYEEGQWSAYENEGAVQLTTK